VGLPPPKRSTPPGFPPSLPELLAPLLLPPLLVLDPPLLEALELVPELPPELLDEPPLEEPPASGAPSVDELPHAIAKRRPPAAANAQRIGIEWIMVPQRYNRSVTRIRRAGGPMPPAGRRS
jgi:hypothetical protein